MPNFKLEHVALNVSDPNAVASWYENNLGMKIVRKLEAAPFTHFMADVSGTVMIEIYNNPSDQVPDYSSMNPLLVHMGFVSNDPQEDKDMLLKAGASMVDELKLPDGTHLVMMRDPWGLAIQLCKRTTPMLTPYL